MGTQTPPSPEVQQLIDMFALARQGFEVEEIDAILDLARRRRTFVLLEHFEVAELARLNWIRWLHMEEIVRRRAAFNAVPL